MLLHRSGARGKRALYRLHPRAAAERPGCMVCRSEDAWQSLRELARKCGCIAPMTRRSPRPVTLLRLLLLACVRAGAHEEQWLADIAGMAKWAAWKARSVRARKGRLGEHRAQGVWGVFRRGAALYGMY